MNLIAMISKFERNNWIIGIGVPMSICLILSSCSNDDADVYDEVLSNTAWQQSYIDAPLEYPEEVIYSPPQDILDRLQSESRTAQETDTINKSIVKMGEYQLSFGADENCQLKDIYHSKWAYQLATYEVEIGYYPNQTYREDVGNGYTTEITVKDDSLILRQFYEENIVKADTIYLGKNNEVKTKVRTLNVSEPLEYDIEDKSETYYMTYIRTGNRVELSGDKHFVGFINDDYSEIDFEEIGSFGRE